MSTEDPQIDLQIERFLAVLATQRAPRTVDAYTRDLADLTAFLQCAPAVASASDLERWLADLRSRELAPSSIARRLAAARSFYKHLVLLGDRNDNPGNELASPRRARKLPRTLSPREIESLCDAANGTTPRSLRDRALTRGGCARGLPSQRHSRGSAGRLLS